MNERRVVLVRGKASWYAMWGILYGEDDCVYMVVSGHAGHAVNTGGNPQPGELVILRSVGLDNRNIASSFAVRSMTASDRRWVIER
jgi:hypothetical protein